MYALLFQFLAGSSPSRKSKNPSTVGNTKDYTEVFQVALYYCVCSQKLTKLKDLKWFFDISAISRGLPKLANIFRRLPNVS